MDPPAAATATAAVDGELEDAVAEPLGPRDFAEAAVGLVPAPIAAAKLGKLGAAVQHFKRVSKELIHSQQSISSYVPDVVIQRHYEIVQQGLDAPPAPMEDATEATVLLADISGFTKLNKFLLDTKGAEGPELMCNYLNDYFSRMMEVIFHFEGDVLKFAGDALIVFWPSQDAETARKATQCGLMMVSMLNEHEVVPTIKLSLHAAVANGPATAMHVGGVNNRWEFLLTGDLFQDIGVLIDQSSAGEVALSKAVFALAKEGLETLSPTPIAAVTSATEEAGETVGWLLPVAAYHTTVDLVIRPPPRQRLQSLEGLLCRYIPVMLHSAMTKGHMHLLGSEMREISVLFCMLPPAASVAACQRVLMAMLLLLDQNQGVLRQMLTDDKGTVIIAAFGLPGLSSLNQEKRAVKTAWVLATTLGADMQVSIGITTGIAFCGSVGSIERCEYCVVGSSVNSSARLMSKARKWAVPILCDAATRNAAEEFFSFDAGTAVELKGYAEPVMAYRVLSELEAPSAVESHHLVGRNSQLDLIWGLLNARRFDSTSGSVVWVSGTMGSGKTRLSEAIVRRARSYEFHLLKSVCSSSHSEGDSRAWLSASQLLRAGLAQGGKALLHRYLSAEQLDLAPLLCNFGLLPFWLPATSKSSAVTGEKATFEICFDLCVALLSKIAAASKTGFLVDDVDYIDAVSWDILTKVIAREPGTCLLVTYGGRSSRQGGASSERLEDKAIPPTNAPVQLYLNIKPLLYDITRELAMTILQAQAPPDAALSKYIFSRTGGNPLFIVELCRYLERAGDVAIELGDIKWSGNDGAAGDGGARGKGIQNIIRSRIDQCSPGARMVLKFASVLGISFSLAALEAIFPLREEIPLLEIYVTEVISRNFCARTEAPRVFAFLHKSVQEVTYRLLTAEQRRQAHGQAAKYLERTPEPDTEALAWHWNQSDSPERAVKYLAKQGYAYSFLGKNGEAKKIYLRVLELLPPDDTIQGADLQTKLEVLAKLGQSVLALRQLDAVAGERNALGVFQLGRDLAVAKGADEALLCPLLSGLMVAHTIYDMPEGVPVALDEFMKAAARCKDPLHSMRALEAGSRYAISQGDVRLYEERLAKAYAIYSEDPGRGRQCVECYGSNWGIVAASKHMYWLLVTGRLLEFHRTFLLWRGYYETVNHKLSFKWSGITYLGVDLARKDYASLRRTRQWVFDRAAALELEYESWLVTLLEIQFDDKPAPRAKMQQLLDEIASEGTSWVATFGFSLVQAFMELALAFGYRELALKADAHREAYCAPLTTCAQTDLLARCHGVAEPDQAAKLFVQALGEAREDWQKLREVQICGHITDFLRALPDGSLDRTSTDFKALMEAQSSLGRLVGEVAAGLSTSKATQLLRPSFSESTFEAVVQPVLAALG